MSSRYKFFMVAFSASFIWYWFPDFIFPALGWFTWICWIAPKNKVVNQVFGMKSGLGLIPITFDCRSTIGVIPRPILNKIRGPDCIHRIAVGHSHMGNSQHLSLTGFLDLHCHSRHLLH